MPEYTKSEKARYIGFNKGALVSYNLFLKKIDKMQKRTVLFSRPNTLQFEPTTKCNLKCPLCESTIWDRKGKDMKFSDFKKIIDQFPYLTTLLLQGIGEPLLCKDFFEMIDYCKLKKILVGITSNGTLIDEEMAKKLVEHEIDYMIISIDGATAETFEKTKVGAKFEDVIGNTVNLIKARGDRKKPKILFHFTGTKDNIHELPQVVKLAKDIGVDVVEAQDTHFWGDEMLKEKLIGNTMRQEMVSSRKFANEALILAKELGISFDWLGTGGKKSLYSDTDMQMHADQVICKKMFRSCFITADGYVTTCACSPDPRKLNFGNVLEQDFNTIWNSPKYVAFRKSRLEGKMPDFCNMCTVPHLNW